MSTIRVLLAVSSVALCGAVISGAEGCAQPGVIETNPAPPLGKDAGGSSTATKKDAGKTGSTSSPANADDGSGDTSDTSDTSDTNSDDTTDSSDDSTTTGNTKLDGGSKQGSGTASGKDAGSSKPSTGDDAGGGSDTTTGAAGACPSGWMCSDPMKGLSDMGISGMVTDQDGNAISTACGNGGLVMCSDPTDPKKSCPAELTDPFCAHISLGALGDFQSCAQRCSM